MNKQLTIGRQILLGFGFLLALFCVVAVIACAGLYTTRDDFVAYRMLARHSVLAGRVQANFLDMRIAVKEYQDSRAEKWISEYEDRAERTKQFLSDADAQMADPEQAALVDKMLAGVEEHLRGVKELVPALRDPSGAARAVQIEEKMNVAGQSVSDAAEQCKRLIIAQQDKLGPKVQARVVQTAMIMIISAISALVVGIGSAWLIVRRTTRTLGRIAQALGEGAEQVAAAASQSSSASQSLAEGSSEQAASLEETSASLEEVASMAKHNAENAEKAKNLSAQTRSAADSGATEMEAMRRAMDDIKASSNEVAKILKSIDDIAFQTNILALNAAVEAARAGEAGMGFSVVAEEVRNLAQRSATSAKETAAKISDAISKSEHGVQISGKVAASLSEIVEKARNVDSLVGEIAAASAQQNQGLTQVNTAVSQMDKVTQSTAGNAEETAAASEELSSQAEMMRQSVRDLLAFVGTSGERRNGGVRRGQAELERPAGSEAGSDASRPTGAKGAGRAMDREPATPLL